MRLQVTLQPCPLCFTTGVLSALSCLIFKSEMKEQPETGSVAGLRSVFPSHSGARVELQEVGVVLPQREIEKRRHGGGQGGGDRLGWGGRELERERHAKCGE